MDQATAELLAGYEPNLFDEVHAQFLIAFGTLTPSKSNSDGPSIEIVEESGINKDVEADLRRKEYNRQLDLIYRGWYIERLKKKARRLKKNKRKRKYRKNGQRK